MNEHILMKNFIAVSSDYFSKNVVPSLDETKRAAQPTERWYEIAGKLIRVFSYGAKMDECVSVALSHRAHGEDEKADLTMYAWDATTTGKPLIAPWDDDTFDKEAMSVKSKSMFGVYISGEETLTFYDEEAKVGYFWAHDANLLPDWAIGAPFRAILHWFLGESDIHLVHGAVVGSNGHAVLLTARSGAGKSTTALSSVLAGMEYISDDYAALSIDGSVVHAHSLYHSAKVTKGGLELFPELKPAVWNKGFSDREKALLFMNDLVPNQVKKTLPVSAIMIPKISSETKLVPAHKHEALLAIAPTTLLQLPFAEKTKIKAFKEIIDRVPCYFLELGPDIRSIPDAIKNFLDNQNAPS